VDKGLFLPTLGVLLDWDSCIGGDFEPIAVDVLVITGDIGICFRGVDQHLQDGTHSLDGFDA